MPRIDYRLTKKEMDAKVRWWYDQGRCDMMIDCCTCVCDSCRLAILRTHGKPYEDLKQAVLC